MGQDRTRLVDKVYDVRCPNCALELPAADRTNPEVRYGDRILVLKYLYLFQEPRRWDVVVFKSPDDPAYQQNFIKRLVGKPGESIMILDGDIYVGKGNDSGTYRIQSKPRYVQQDLWRNIYDNDHYPLGRVNRADPWRQPWGVADEHSGWSGLGTQRGQQRRVFAFDNMDGGSTIRFDPNANQTNAFTDYLVYDLEEVQRVGARYRANPVSDLKLEFFYRRKAGDGPLRLRMTKGGDAFITELTPGRAKLIHERGVTSTVIGEAAISDQRAAVKVELTNHDYQVSLRIDDQELIRTTAEQYQPDVKSMLAQHSAGRSGAMPTLQIAAQRQQSQISHLKLA
ncbi:MAG: signal peptidase I, partial [Gemmatimonadaceae bacterium]|nr:signal peptidase I [Gemmatimonadaceae bacterium]